MNIKAFLVISRSGTLRVVKNRPYLNNTEIAVTLDINVPNKFFERLMPTVSIDLPEEAIVNPDTQAVIKISALEIADKLNLDVTAVEDGLRTMLEEKASKDPSKYTSREVAIELHKHGFYVPSMYYYEWTGATEIEELTEAGWLEDSINVYTEAEIDAYFPKNVAVNENVVEFGIKPEDNEATKKAKVMVHLLKTGIIDKIDATG